MRRRRLWKRGSGCKLSSIKSDFRDQDMSKDLSEYALSRNSKALSFSPRPAYMVAIVYGGTEAPFDLRSKSRRIFSAWSFLPAAEYACARATAGPCEPSAISIAFWYSEIAS